MVAVGDCALADLDAVYKIALATGDAGADASELYRDPKLVGHIYAAPYALLAPELALVIEDEQGVGGYIVSAFCTRAFEELLERSWWPALRATLADPGAALLLSTATADARAWQTIHHPHRAPDWLVERHSSHLHVNLLPWLQGGGHGDRLLRAWAARARELGSAGFHLGVNPANSRAVRFYEKFGLERLLSPDEIAGGAIWFGSRLPEQRAAIKPGRRHALEQGPQSSSLLRCSAPTPPAGLLLAPPTASGPPARCAAPAIITAPSEPVRLAVEAAAVSVGSRRAALTRSCVSSRSAPRLRHRTCGPSFCSALFCRLTGGRGAARLPNPPPCGTGGGACFRLPRRQPVPRRRSAFR